MAMATSASAADVMLSREQLHHLFSRFAFLTSQPNIKKRISDAVKDKQLSDTVMGKMPRKTFSCLLFWTEAVAITTAIQEEILLEMGIDPRFGIACLGRVNVVYENDEDLMIQFYKFVAKEEMAIDEAELEPHEFAEKMHNQLKLQEQQLEMLTYIRKFHQEDQSAILDALCKQMESAYFDNSAAVLTVDQIQEIIRRRSTTFIDSST